MTPTSTGLVPELGGLVTVWEAPQAGVYYDLGLDPSGGNTSDGRNPDWSVAEILRRDTLEQVAECRVHMNPASHEFIDLIYWLALAYNTAQINPDITGGWGMALMTELQRRSYHHIWRWRRRVDARERVSDQIGFYATPRDKGYLVHNAAMIVTRGEAVIHSDVLYDEMAAYMAIGLDRWEGRPKDDTVFAFMLALLSARDATAAGEPGGVAPAKSPAEELAEQLAKEPWKYHDVVNDLEAPHPVLVNLEPWR
jgi:hypothetical protein